MEVATTINPGICGFDTVLTAQSEDAQNVEFVFDPKKGVTSNP
jgi:hypothetical protein